MKRTDLAMIILIAAVSAGIAYFVAHSVFGGISQKGVTVQTIDPITSQIQAPDTDIFNSNAINPAVEVNISDSSTTTGVTDPNPGTTTPSSTDNSAP